MHEYLSQAGRISRWPLATITGSQLSGSKCGESSFATLRGYGCLDASGAEACQKTTHVQSSWGGSEGERALTPRTPEKNIHHRAEDFSCGQLLVFVGTCWEVTFAMSLEAHRNDLAMATAKGHVILEVHFCGPSSLADPSTHGRRVFD